MADQSVTLPEVVQVLATDAKTYPDGYIIRMQLRMEGKQGKQSILVTIRPFDKTTNAICPSAEYDINYYIDDLQKEVIRVPRLAQTVASMTKVMNLLLSEKVLMQKISDSGISDVAGAAAQENLVAARLQLGIG